MLRMNICGKIATFAKPQNVIGNPYRRQAMTDQKNNATRPYDKSKMQYKDNILRFQWGDFKAIGIKHFEERRDERTKKDGTDIFDQTNLSDEEVLLECFKILEKQKYRYIIDTIEKNEKNGKRTEWVVGFETDELAEKGNDYKFVFLVFSISIKETAMNDIAQGEKFLSCITVVKDTYKNIRKLPDNTVEETLCYFRPDGGDHKWKKEIQRNINKR